MKRIIFTITMAIILAGGTLFAACAEKPTPAPTPTPAPKPSPAPAPAPTPKPEGPVYGGVLRSAALDDAPSYDSMRSSTTRIQSHAATAFSGLVRTDPMKEAVSVENMIPDLAESWDISPDGKVYTFYLRKGVKWHDGETFTAEDAKYSLDKFRDPALSAFAASIEPVEKVEIVDDYTVKVYFKYVYPPFLMMIAPPYFTVQPEHLKDVSIKDTKFLTGTGPFMFKSRIPGKVTIYERNPDYFVEGLPYLDGHQIYAMTRDSLVSAFVAGRLDVGGTLRNYFMGVENIKKAQQFAPEAVMRFQPKGTTRGVIFNLQREGPWQDLRVRQAMALVVDYEGTVMAAFGGTPAETGYIAPCGYVDFSVPEALPLADVKKLLGLDQPMEARIDRAKALMAEAGYPNGFSTTLLTLETDIYTAVCLLVSDLWKRYLNIDMEVDMVDAALVFDRQETGQFDMAYITTGSASGIWISEFLTNMVTGEYANSGRWSNAEFDQLYSQIQEEVNTQKRIELARKAQTIAFSELPYLPFQAPSVGTAWRPDLMTGWPPKQGIVFQPSYSTLQSISHIWFAGTPDAEKWIKTQKK
ncbi:ABC transporter substrate-binding protein [Chloroflexota bacterium]